MNKPIFTFRKNATEEIRVSLHEYRGRKYFDIRAFREKDTGHLEFLRTAKGLTLSVYILPELKKAILALEKELIRRGILETDER